jgi:hypothetical protein
MDNSPTKSDPISQSCEVAVATQHKEPSQMKYLSIMRKADKKHLTEYFSDNHLETREIFNAELNTLWAKVKTDSGLTIIFTELGNWYHLLDEKYNYFLLIDKTYPDKFANDFLAELQSEVVKSSDPNSIQVSSNENHNFQIIPQLWEKYKDSNSVLLLKTTAQAVNKGTLNSILKTHSRRQNSMQEETKTGDRDALTDAIYLGSNSQTCTLTKVNNSQSWEFSRSSLLNHRDNFTVALGLANKASLSHLGPQYQDIYLPCPPANALLFHNHHTTFKNTSDPKLQTANSILSNVLIKTEGQVDGVTHLQGFKSGKRSAIFNWENKSYRLKGCGNNTEGFPLEPLISTNKNAKEVRGCQFLHTAQREQWMTNYASKILHQEGILVGNVPVGIWKYEYFQKDNALNLKDETPLIDKFCGVFETFGEKRLATHLLQGLEVLLHFIIKEAGENEDIIEQLVKDLPLDRIHRDADAKLTDIDPSSWEAPFLDVPTAKTIHEWCKEPIYLEETNKRLLNLYEGLMTGKYVDQINYKAVFEKLAEDFKGINEKSPILMNIFNQSLATLKEETKGLLVLLSRVYSRLGWEVGRVKRILQDKDINWGYYYDHEPNTFHCNAHPNNFVVLPPGKSKNILGVLDFDLSFLRENFISITNDTEKYAHLNNEEFDTFLNSERYALETALGGMENMGNFVYNTITLEELSKSKKVYYDVVRTALRDTIMKSYRKGYDKVVDEEMNGFNAANEKSLYSLVNIALVITDGAMC